MRRVTKTNFCYGIWQCYLNVYLFSRFHSDRTKNAELNDVNYFNQRAAQSATKLRNCN